MKSLLIAFAFALPFFAVAQSPEQRQIASKTPALMQAVRAKTLAMDSSNSKIDAGNYSKESIQAFAYDASILWNGNIATNGFIEAHWIGIEDLSDRSCKPDVLATTYKAVALEPRKKTIIRVVSPLAESSKDRYRILGVNEKEGQKITAVVLRLVMDGNIVQAFTSAGHLQKYLWLPDFTIDPALAKKRADEIKKNKTVPKIPYPDELADGGEAGKNKQ